MRLPFPALVAEGMARRGLSLRAFCRAVGLDPSFVSKVLSGKRSPPAEEAVLRRIAEVLGLGPAELIVAAGRIPSEWGALWRDPQLFRVVHAQASGAGGKTAAARPRPPALRAVAPPLPKAGLADELL
jgi:transcriptional regulator with XRE-family HTH domain